MKTKDRLRNQPHPGPSLPKEGNFKLQSSDQEGLGVVRLSALGVLCALAGNRRLAAKAGNAGEFGKRCFLEGTNSVILGK